MSEVILASGACVLAGIMTTVHPCPLTTNIASVSLLTGWPARRSNKGLTLFFFICGYLFSYMVIAVLLSSGALSIPRISYALQVLVNYFLGPEPSDQNQRVTPACQKLFLYPSLIFT